MTNPSSQQFQPILLCSLSENGGTLGNFFQGWVLLIIFVVSGSILSNHQKKDFSNV